MRKHAYNLKHLNLRHWKGADRTLCGVPPHWHLVTREETEVKCENCLGVIRTYFNKKFNLLRQQQLDKQNNTSQSAS